MKRVFKVIASIMLVFALVSPAHAVFKDMWATVYTWDGGINSDGRLNLTKVTSGITFKVLQRNSDTAETLYEYNDDTMTSLTNPVTTTNFESATVCNDKVAFRVDPGETNDTYVDVIVVDANGMYTKFVEDFDENTHTIVIDERPGVPHTGMIWFTSTTTYTDTGIDFDYDTLVRDVWVEATTSYGAATQWISVGLLSSESSGDLDGFRYAVSVSSSGYVREDGIVAAGSSCDFYGRSNYGAYLINAIAGTGQSAVATGPDNGGRMKYGGYVISGSSAKSLVYTLKTNGLKGAGTAVGYIYVDFVRLR